MSVDKIDREALKLILGASKSSHPNEFAGILRSEGTKITEVLLLPGTFTSERSALMNLYMLPISSHSCGSVHSHSSSIPEPSTADLSFFDKFGEIHLIVASPYNESSWKAFNKGGKEVKLEIVESEGGNSASSEYHEEFWR